MRISVVVTPRAGKSEVAGWRTDASGRRELAVSVTSPAEGGKATREACDVIAGFLGVSKSRVTCVRGATSRHKQMEIDAPEEKLEETFGGPASS